MDIGDPSEIPATRKKLPSMQELGAFDLAVPSAERPLATDGDTRQTPRATAPARPVPIAAQRPLPRAKLPEIEPLATTQAVPPTAPVPPRDTPTADQLRQAIARADPDTRRKLLRLIAGGQPVQQRGNPAAPDGVQRRSLVMQREPSAAHGARADAAHGARADAGHAAAASTRAASPPGAKPSPGPVPQRPPVGNGEPLMQIDANTQLLDAAAPVPTAAQRQAEMQAQVDAALAPTVPRRDAAIDPAAPKVLFPAYDPDQHGSHLHSPVRRRKEAPVEGHFPAPRQPFQATYHHADGRPMTAEENKVEQVLQEQRCDETLSVLARDGVNGLLLSPRDLDAAVANGLLPAETAATLWKTWAALRPVIHVIEDDPVEAAVEPVTGADGEADADATNPLAAPAEPTSAAPVSAADALPVDPPVADAPAAPVAAAEPALPVTPEPAARASLQAAQAVQAAQTDMPEPIEATLPLGTRALDPDMSAASTARHASADTPPVAATPTLTTPPSTPRLRMFALLRGLGWLFVAFCVVTTTARLATWAWLRWGHWLPSA